VLLPMTAARADDVTADLTVELTSLHDCCHPRFTCTKTRFVGTDVRKTLKTIKNR